MKYKEKLISVNVVQMCISTLPKWPSRNNWLNLLSNFSSSPDISLMGFFMENDEEQNVF